MPDNEDLLRLELAQNGLNESDLAPLSKYCNLSTLKLASNNLKDISDLEFLKSLKTLKNLDLEKNPVTKLSDYKSKLFEMLPSLQVLDNHNRRGELVFSDDEDDFGAEGGEDEYSENDAHKYNLNEDLMEELRMRGISP